MGRGRRAFPSSSAPDGAWGRSGAVAFTDGTVGWRLCWDRNGLRWVEGGARRTRMVAWPARPGFLDLDPATVSHGARLPPGKMFLVDRLPAGSYRTTIIKAAWPRRPTTMADGRL